MSTAATPPQLNQPHCHRCAPVPEDTPFDVVIEKLRNQYHTQIHDIFRGIKLAFVDLSTCNQTVCHAPLSHVIEINYCHQGRAGIHMHNGNSVYLGAGDFALNTMDTCASMELSIPQGQYTGLTLYLDTKELAQNLPEFLVDTEITPQQLIEKFCAQGATTALAGNYETQAIFRDFFGQPAALQLSYWKIKTLELLLYLSKLELHPGQYLSEYQAYQIQIAREVHDYLLHNLNIKITIDELAKRFYTNPTTLKTVFKSVYGSSIARHIKEHKLLYAAQLLLEQSKSIKEIAYEIGYANQSKFTQAFKEYFQVLPTEYRASKLLITTQAHMNYSHE